MKITFIMAIALGLVVVSASAMSFNQSWANPGHRQSFAMVMDGLHGDGFYEMCKAVSAAADEKCMAYYREIGMMSGIGNHRFMGHWGWTGDIPQEVFERGAKLTPPVSKSQIVSVWQKIHNETVDVVVQKTGLPPKAADAFAGILYDTHLLHDYTGEFAEALQNPSAIQKDVVRNLHRLFGNRSVFVRNLEVEISNALKNVPVGDQPRVLLSALAKNDIGKEMYKVYGERFLAKQGIVYSDSVAAKVATVNKGVNEQFFGASLSHAIKDCGQRVDGTKVERVVRGVYSEIEKNGKKAYRLQIPLQFSTEERIASQYAKECLNAAGGDLSEEQLANLVAQRLRDPKVASLPKEGIQRTASNAAKWAKMNSDKLAVGVKAGILTFCITEGITVVTFAETDMDIEDFWRQTEKNLGGALLQGTATYVLVALGANPFTWPGGLIVLGVGIGTQIVYDFAWTKLEQYLDSLYFSLDDFIGDLPEEIRNRATVLSAFEFEQFDSQNKARLSTIDYLLTQEAREAELPFLFDLGQETPFDYRGTASPIDKPVRKDNPIDFLQQTNKE